MLEHLTRPNPRQESRHAQGYCEYRFVSPYHNPPAGDLADQLGAVKAEIGVLQDREKSLRDELLRRGVSEVAGAAFGASISEGIWWTLNTQAIKTEMGLAWYDARCRQQSITTVSVKPLAAVAAQRVAA